MRLVWTKSTLPLSVVIRAITGEDCSHFAFVFDSPGGGMVFQANLLGCGPEFFAKFKSACTIVHEVTLDVPTEIEDQVWDLVVSNYDGKPYGYKSCIYLGYRILLRRIFGIPMPDKNPYVSSGAFFCDELYACLAPIPGLPKFDVADGMKTPHDVWKAVKGITG